MIASRGFMIRRKGASEIGIEKEEDRGSGGGRDGGVREAGRGMRGKGGEGGGGEGGGGGE